MYSTRYSCWILLKLEFSRQIFEKIQISSFIKILLEKVELSHTERQTDGQKDRRT